MKILDLKQLSPEWHAYRQNHIMATDCSIILKKNPWETPRELWQRKLGLVPAKEETDAMRRGRDLEDEAREQVCRELCISFDPAVVESDSRPWQAASLDGLSTCLKIILEIKCPNEKTHNFSVNENGILNYYFAQMQHQFAVTECEIGYYMSYRPGHVTPWKIIEVKPDAEYIADLNEAEERFFLESLIGKKEPEILQFRAQSGLLR